MQKKNTLKAITATAVQFEASTPDELAQALAGFISRAGLSSATLITSKSPVPEVITTIRKPKAAKAITTPKTKAKNSAPAGRKKSTKGAFLQDVPCSWGHKSGDRKKTQEGVMTIIHDGDPDVIKLLAQCHLSVTWRQAEKCWNTPHIRDLPDGVDTRSLAQLINGPEYLNKQRIDTSISKARGADYRKTNYRL